MLSGLGVKKINFDSVSHIFLFIYFLRSYPNSLSQAEGIPVYPRLYFILGTGDSDETLKDTTVLGLAE